MGKPLKRCVVSIHSSFTFRELDLGLEPRLLGAESS
jgi:hypothetical protein